jgi:hypothetical protein
METEIITLRLAVKREYFEQIKSGDKMEEYRIINKYWINRIAEKSFDVLTITLGYPKSGDKEKELHFKYNGYKIKEINHKHFGNKPVLVFAIDLSERI